MSYVVVYTTEDGTRIKVLSAAEVEELLRTSFPEPTFVTPRDMKLCDDPRDWSNDDILIVNGDIVVPQKGQVVTKWIIP